MKSLSAKYFIYIFMKACPHKKKIMGRTISRIKKEAKDVLCPNLELTDFIELENVCPDYIELKDNCIIINPCRDFKRMLENMLLFSKDKGIEEYITKLLKEEKQNTYATEDITLVSPENEELKLSASVEVENADDYDKKYLDMIFKN